MNTPFFHRPLTLAAVLLAANLALAETPNQPAASGGSSRPAFSAKRLDRDGDGRISLEEFYPTGPEPLHPRMKQVFESFDKEHRGSLSYEDTVRVIAEVSGLRPKLTPDADGAFRPIAIEVNPKTKRAMIKAKVNGVEGRFLLDTGTSDTIFNADFGKRAGVDFVEICTSVVSGNYGKKGDTISLIRVPDMEIAGTHFRNFHAVLMEPKHKYEFGHDGQLDGVMGANVLFLKPLTLDYRHQMAFFATNPPATSDLTFNLIPGVKGVPIVRAQVDGVPFELMFDSGAAIGDAVLINEPYHAAVRKLAGSSEAKTYNSKEIRADGQMLATNKVCLLNPFERSVIGSVFFDRHVITVDSAAGKVWINRNSDVDKP